MKATNLEKVIMEKIKKDEIKMKPKWWFKIKNGSLKGIFLLAILLASIILSMMAYRAKTDTPLELLEYGEIGVEIFIKGFPYLWLLGGIVVVVAATVLMTKVGENYKKRIYRIVLTTIILILISTVLISILGNYFSSFSNFWN